MSEMKWTRGPWMVSPESPTIIRKDYRNIGSDDGFLIASTVGRDDSGFYATEAEAFANAHLIAAAPEMYEALRRCVDALDVTMGDTDLTDEHDDGSEEFQAFRAGLAALEKARGEG